MIGDEIIGNLTKAFRTVTVSRKRALQLIAGVIAVAVPSRLPQTAEAGKRSKPPLAVAWAMLLDIRPTPLTTVTVLFKGAVVHKESGDQVLLNSSGDITATATGDGARKEVLSLVRFRAVEALRNQLGLEVPEDRIAVNLF